MSLSIYPQSCVQMEIVNSAESAASITEAARFRRNDGSTDKVGRIYPLDADLPLKALY
jgi:hypothetical protein